MKIGDLVAIRFDDAVVLGFLTGSRGNEHSFLHVSGRDLIEDALPRSRFIQIRVLGTRPAPPFTNLCDHLNWEGVEVKHRIDAKKFHKWMNLPDQKMD